MPNNEIIFGWGAPPLKEQHPVLSDDDASHFDQDNMAIIRCHLRGLIPDSQRNAAFQKLTRKIESCIRERLKKSA